MNARVRACPSVQAGVWEDTLRSVYGRRNAEPVRMARSVYGLITSSEPRREARRCARDADRWEEEEDGDDLG